MNLRKLVEGVKVRKPSKAVQEMVARLKKERTLTAAQLLRTAVPPENRP